MMTVLEDAFKCAHVKCKTAQQSIAGPLTPDLAQEAEC